MKKPTVILFQSGRQKLFLNLLSVLAVKCDGDNATVVTNIDELRADGMADRILRRVRDQYNLVALSGSGVSTSGRSNRPAALSFNDENSRRVVLFQRGLRHLSITDRAVTVVPVKGSQTVVRLDRPIAPDGQALLSQLGLA